MGGMDGGCVNHSIFHVRESYTVSRSDVRSRIASEDPHRHHIESFVGAYALSVLSGMDPADELASLSPPVRRCIRDVDDGAIAPPLGRLLVYALILTDDYLFKI